MLPITPTKSIKIKRQENAIIAKYDRRCVTFTIILGKIIYFEKSNWNSFNCKNVY